MLKKKICKQCGGLFLPFRSGQPVCSPVCAVNYNREKESKKQTKEAKEKFLTLGDWHKVLQPIINAIARKIDCGQPCIATGFFKGKMNGGHYVAVGSNPSLRYNLHNIHVQSEHSNSFKGGDNLRYQDGLKKVYGLEYFEYVDSLRMHYKHLGLSIEDIKALIPIARKILRELPENEIYSALDRIKLRSEINNKLGIYDHPQTT